MRRNAREVPVFHTLKIFVPEAISQGQKRRGKFWVRHTMCQQKAVGKASSVPGERHK